MRGDLELLTAWRDGDAAAGEALIERHFDTLARFFVTKVPTGAEDLVQETLLGCVQAHRRCASDTDFPAFLIGIARNKLLMYWRKRMARRNASEIRFEEVSLETLGMTASQAIADRQEQRLLLRGLRSIPVEDQILMELFYWESLSGPQLAAALQIPEGTVRSRLRRAKGRLRRTVEELSTSPELARSTADDLERWAASMRGKWGRGAGDG